MCKMVDFQPQTQNNAGQSTSSSVASLPPKSGLNMLEIVKEYFEGILSEQPGRKALILDQATLVTISMVYSRTQIL